MPSLHEFFLPYVDHVVQMLGILQIEVVLVFPDDHHVVASIVVVGIGSMDVGWLEVLQQNDDRL